MAQINKILDGIVVSDKAEKTVIVSVSSRAKTRYKGKTIKRSKKYHAHDEKNDYKVGDKVSIIECRPFSKTKKFKVYEVKNDTSTN